MDTPTPHGNSPAIPRSELLTCMLIVAKHDLPHDTEITRTLKCLVLREIRGALRERKEEPSHEAVLQVLRKPHAAQMVEYVDTALMLNCVPNAFVNREQRVNLCNELIHALEQDQQVMRQGAEDLASALEQEWRQSSGHGSQD